MSSATPGPERPYAADRGDGTGSRPSDAAARLLAAVEAFREAYCNAWSKAIEALTATLDAAGIGEGEPDEDELAGQAESDGRNR